MLYFLSRNSTKHKTTTFAGFGFSISDKAFTYLDNHLFFISKKTENIDLEKKFYFDILKNYVSKQSYTKQTTDRPNNTIYRAKDFENAIKKYCEHYIFLRATPTIAKRIAEIRSGVPMLSKNTE